MRRLTCAFVVLFSLAAAAQPDPNRPQTSRTAVAAAQFPCTGPKCLTVSKNGWIVGEIRTFAFGADNQAKIMDELMAAGWVECAGQPLSRDGKFRPLFNAIGDAWGSADGAVDFYLPDLRGVFLRGWDHGRGRDTDAAARATPRPEINPPGTQGHNGDRVASSQADAMRDHRHRDPGHDHHVGQYRPKVLGYNGYGNTWTISNEPAQPNWPTSSSSTNLAEPIAPDGSSVRLSGGENRPLNAYVMYAIYVGLPVRYDNKGRLVAR